MNIYANGVFDLFHIGHLNRLKRAKRLGGTLIVGINTDEMTEDYKHRKPVIPYEERRKIVAALRCVDKTIPHVAVDEVAFLDKYNIDVVVVGPEWGKIPGQEVRKKYMDKRGIRLVVHPYTKGISTTFLIEKIRGNNG